jgi:hypothetical protein
MLQLSLMTAGVAVYGLDEHQQRLPALVVPAD